MKDALIQRIAGCHQLRTLIWPTLVVLNGGLAAIFGNLGKPAETILFIAGVLLEVFFIFLIFLLKETNKCPDRTYRKLEGIKCP